ncbi:Z1 domain-containing protein [Edaphobacillus lindanitolerans]|uniref:Z1 domain-containing protein n=1 Tax=Edaphobacillus lindanitolerans TaxID=550447 RepID=A0A1U7PL68_9BACI|nr:Z1 domain-containing protein [Edaphobacillus lindanitolerans]SIT87321.1 Z1 domain-containing protein [Edaphobacillus lindanitolerans]
MADYSSTKYDEKRNAIRNMKDMGRDWAYIYSYGKNNDEELQQMLDFIYETGNFDYTIRADEWKEIVTEQKEIEEKARQVVMVSGGVEQGSLEVPKHEKSSWQLYKQKLRSQNFSADAIRELEESTLAILRKLSQDTTDTGPRKGLMIGHVQSGKTASMAGLMAMAADHGWNMFIILSGIIENLRVQTADRLVNDLTYRTGNLSWRALNHLSIKSPLSDKTQSLSFDQFSRDRYFTVCLKNKTRLNNLAKWLYEDKNKLTQMKILVIDDEADQAGINTANIDSDDRTAINSEILNLVEGPDEVNAGAMNYISYTATPYANVLNEAGDRTLYPKDFIGLLPTSTEYFGPKQIFGAEGTQYEGLDIIRMVDEEEIRQINEMQKENMVFRMTPGLKDAVAWFLCSVAMMRHNGHKKPISMLIHTSHLTEVHGKMAELISTWLSGMTDKELLNVCRDIYHRECGRFTVEDLYDSFEDYSVSRNKINNYPPFEKLESEILELKKLSHIKLGDDDTLEYHEGVHLCIDNCRFNKTEDESFVRLAYPDKRKLEKMDKAPAFLIVGGNTLSRGLTLEGLVSTYFLRVGRQADTLMQMGRWFGYRHGYELYQRIWMTEDTREKFAFLATLEEELRSDLKTYKDTGASPEEYGLRIKNSPKVSWMRITGANRSQGAVMTNWDFSGTSNQTVTFNIDEEVLKHNIQVAEDLLDSLPSPTTSPLNKSSLVWKNVDFNLIKEKFFSKYSVSKNATALNDMSVFCEWYEGVQDEIGFRGWTVVLGGTKNKESSWDIGGNKVGKVVRKVRNNKEEGSVSLGVLRAPADLYADFTEDDLVKAGINSSNLPISNSEVNANRELVGLGKTPMLIIYRINKDKLYKDDQTPKRKIAEDLVGISVVVPGAKTGKSFAKRLIIDIDRFVNSTGTDVEE